MSYRDDLYKENSKAFGWSTTTTYSPAAFEFKVVDLPSRMDVLIRAEWFNNFGKDGWDLKGFEYGAAIFSRPITVAVSGEKE